MPCLLGSTDLSGRVHITDVHSEAETRAVDQHPGNGTVGGVTSTGRLGTPFTRWRLRTTRRASRPLCNP